jgi:hypothetical protein
MAIPTPESKALGKSEMLKKEVHYFFSEVLTQLTKLPCPLLPLNWTIGPCREECIHKIASGALAPARIAPFISIAIVKIRTIPPASDGVRRASLSETPAEVVRHCPTEAPSRFAARLQSHALEIPDDTCLPVHEIRVAPAAIAAPMFETLTKGPLKSAAGMKLE